MNKLISLPKIGSAEQGFLTFFEINKDIPFEVKRIYYTYDVQVNTKRGMHAHKRLQQVLWCPYGEIEVILDNGVLKQSFLLDSPNKALLVPPGYWHDMYWRKEGSVLCVAADDYYKEEDYIRDYGQFLIHEKEGFWNHEN